MKNEKENVYEENAELRHQIGELWLDKTDLSWKLDEAVWSLAVWRSSFLVAALTAIGAIAFILCD